MRDHRRRHRPHPARLSLFVAADTCDIEMIRMDEINTAYERMLKSDVKYRFVIDMASLKSE